MRGRALAISLFVALAGFGGLARAVERFALVVGNNRPDRPGQPLLRYADDDAARMYRLLVQAGAKAELLVDFDDDTARSAGDLHPAGPPSRAVFAAVYRKLREQMKKASTAGRRVEFVFFFSGHGDVEHGEGYLVMDGWRLTRSELARILSLSPAAANHLVIDACNSYFMVFGRGPGGKRSPASGFAGHLAAGLSERNGLLLSTSTGSESHEWQRFAAGVFSHLVLSALRGAADMNADGRISYAELGAYMDSATASIEPENLRPGFFLRPPGPFPGDLDTALLEWPEDTPRLIVDGGVGRGFLEDSRGTRLVDFNTPSQKLVVYLPERGPLFLHGLSGGREWRIDRPRGVLRLSDLESRKERLAIAKGAVNRALEQLYKNPFRASDVAAFRRTYRRAAELASALSWNMPAGASMPPRQAGEPCSVEGRRRCKGDVAQRCGPGELGDAIWLDVADCARDGGVCRDGECHPPGFGGKILFTADISGPTEVWVANDDGSGLRMLSRWARKKSRFWGAYGPRWSPNGRRVAFSYGHYDGLVNDTPEKSRLVVAGEDGTGSKTVMDGYYVPPSCLDWYDAERLVVLTATHVDPCDGDLYLVNIATGRRKLLFRDSPDGFPHPTLPDVNPEKRNLLLYRPYRCGSLDGGLRVFDIATGGESVLVLPGEVHDGARWSPDGRHVAWIRPYSRQIAVVAPGRGGRVETIDIPALPGKEILTRAFDWTEGGFVLVTKPSLDARTQRIWVCDRDGGNLRLVLDAGSEIGDIDWTQGRLGPFSDSACAAAEGHWDSDAAGGFGCWFAAAPGQSCDAACLDRGLSCLQYDWNDFPNSKICNALTGERAARVNNPAYASFAPYLYLPSGSSHGCYHRALAVRQDCSTSGGPDTRRICLCGPFGTGFLEPRR